MTDPLAQAAQTIALALSATNGQMFWDVIFDEEDVIERLNAAYAECGEWKSAVEDTIKSILSSHEETLKSAVSEQCHAAEREALESLTSQP